MLTESCTQCKTRTRKRFFTNSRAQWLKRCCVALLHISLHIFLVVHRGAYVSVGKWACGRILEMFVISKMVPGNAYMVPIENIEWWKQEYRFLIHSVSRSPSTSFHYVRSLETCSQTLKHPKVHIRYNREYDPSLSKKVSYMIFTGWIWLLKLVLYKLWSPM